MIIGQLIQSKLVYHFNVFRFLTFLKCLLRNCPKAEINKSGATMNASDEQLTKKIVTKKFQILSYCLDYCFLISANFGLFPIEK